MRTLFKIEIFLNTFSLCEFMFDEKNTYLDRQSCIKYNTLLEKRLNGFFEIKEKFGLDSNELFDYMKRSDELINKMKFFFDDKNIKIYDHKNLVLESRIWTEHSKIEARYFDKFVKSIKNK